MQSSPISAPSPAFTPASMSELARLFLRMSVLAFGGPVAHIAMGQDEIVEKRRWMTREDYLDVVAATNLIPGPNSTEVMIHVGYLKQGVKGAILAGVCFITPAMLITLAITAVYVASGAIPQVQSLLWGIQPVILAIIAVAGYRLIGSALKTRVLWALCTASLLLILATDLPEVIVMVGSGVIYALLGTIGANRNAATVGKTVGAWLPFIGGIVTDEASGFALRTTRPSIVASLGRAWAWLQPAAETAAVLFTRPAVSAFDLFWYFLRIGSVLFGSGYVLVVYIKQDLVNTFGWITARELLDAVAIGQFTPGPVLTTATAVGYITAGIGGALAATLGVFLPSFVLVILTAPLLPRMKRSPFLRRFLDGANAAVLAAIAAAVLVLAGEALRPLNALTLNVPLPAVGALSVLAAALFAFALFAQIRLKWNATWLVLLGGGIGLAIGLAGGSSV